MALGLKLSELTPLKNYCHIFFREEVGIFDDVKTWPKSCNEETKKRLFLECHYIFNKTISHKLKTLLNYHGFSLEMIAISDWYRYNEVEKKIITTILNMGRVREQVLFRKSKYLTTHSVEYRDSCLRLISHSFRIKNSYVRPRKKNKLYFSKFTKFPQKSFEFLFPNKIQNPFSRSFSVKFKTKLFKRDGYRCGYCSWENGIAGKEDRILTLDHIIPVAHGGTSKEENIVTCCLPCNIKKNDGILDFLIKKEIKTIK